MIAPALDELADAYQGRAKIAKVNVDHNRALAAKYHVRSIPYLVVFKDGEKVGEQIGAVGKAQLAGLLDKALASPSHGMPLLILLRLRPLQVQGAALQGRPPQPSPWMPPGACAGSRQRRTVRWKNRLFGSCSTVPSWPSPVSCSVV